MHCLTDEISSFHWLVLLAIGVAGDETISHVKVLIKPDRSTSQKKASFAALACIVLFPEMNKTPFYAPEYTL